jgi:DNA replication and repair protein RecF
MTADKLELRNFRNFSHAKLEFSPGVNVIYGDNAQGKTNILEALYFLACTKSFRGARDREIIKTGETAAEILLDFRTDERACRLESRLDPEKRKELSFNGIRQAKSAELVGLFSAVLFAPEHLDIVKGSPQVRRKFIDFSLSQISRGYFHSLLTFSRVLAQKNALLQRIARTGRDREVLEDWNRRLSQTAAEMMIARRDFCEELSKETALVHLSLSRFEENLSLEYAPSVPMEEKEDPEGLSGRIGEALARAAEKEIMLGQSVIGPHRDRFELFMNGRPLKVFGSQGQHRSAVLSLKIAESRIFREKIGEYPVLLFDDVMSELDAKRQDYIMNQIEGQQLILTCCEKSRFESLSRGNRFGIEKGAVAAFETVG